MMYVMRADDYSKVITVINKITATAHDLTSARLKIYAQLKPYAQLVPVSMLPIGAKYQYLGITSTNNGSQLDLYVVQHIGNGHFSAKTAWGGELDVYRIPGEFLITAPDTSSNSNNSCKKRLY